MLFCLKLRIDLCFGKSILNIFSLFGSLSGIHSHREGSDLGLDLCLLCSTLVCLLLQLCSFLFSSSAILDLESELLAAKLGIGIALALVGIQNLRCLCNNVVCDDSSVVAIENELVAILVHKLGLNICCFVAKVGLLITVHQHILNTADDVGGVVDQVCDHLYGGELFRRHGDHIHLALGGDGQKANGNNAYAGSTATAKVFLSALLGFCGQIQAAGGKAHRKLGNRNNHQAAGGNDLLTYNGVRINNGANLFQRIPDYFLDRRFVFHNE